MTGLHCVGCGKKATKSGSRTVDQRTHKCTECEEIPPLEENDEENGVDSDLSTVNPDSKLSELTVRDFERYFQRGLDTKIQKKVENATKEFKKEIDALKTSVKKVNEENTALKGEVKKLQENVKTLSSEKDKLTKTCANNLKYLVNHDRNTRRSNVMLLGLSESENLLIQNRNSTTDQEKVDSIFDFIGVDRNQVEVVSFFRLGAEGGEGIRPIKLQLKTGEMVREILTKAPKLKNLAETKIFFKPDKSKKEREEFQRLLKIKRNLLSLIQQQKGAPEGNTSKGSSQGGWG